MVFWLWTAIGLLSLVVLSLSIKIYLLRKSAREIESAFADRLGTDTNAPISISSRDSSMLILAALLNRQLRRLRAQRLKYQRGDAELKSAVTNISHDLRTPLTAICGYLELLDGEPLTEDARRYIGVIRNRADALKELTDELLQYSVISSAEDEPELREVSLSAALEDCAAGFYAALKKRGIEPVISLPDSEVKRLLDPALLSRILSNIIGNALKYSDGDLMISLDGSGKMIFSNYAKSLDGVQVGRLFDRFATVENAGRSTGLGLSIARSLTERMGGEIKAEYRNGRLYIILTFDKRTEPV